MKDKAANGAFIALFAAMIVVMLLIALRPLPSLPPVPATNSSVVTETLPDLSMMQTAQALAEQLSHYRAQECTDAWVPGCFPAPVESITYVGNGTLLVRYNMSAPDCKACWGQLTYRWDGYGFAIVNQIGGGGIAGGGCVGGCGYGGRP